MRRHARLFALLVTACLSVAVPGYAIAQSLLQPRGSLVQAPAAGRVAPAALTGIINLDSQWTPTPPALDGTINTAEWSNAYQLDISLSATPVRLYLMNDADYLYMAIDNQADATADAFDHEIIVFDDEGGTPPALGDGTWNAAMCPATEGAIGGRRLRGFLWNEQCPAIDLDGRSLRHGSRGRCHRRLQFGHRAQGVRDAHRSRNQHAPGSTRSALWSLYRSL